MSGATCPRMHLPLSTSVHCLVALCTRPALCNTLNLLAVACSLRVCQGLTQGWAALHVASSKHLVCCSTWGSWLAAAAVSGVGVLSETGRGWARGRGEWQQGRAHPSCCSSVSLEYLPVRLVGCLSCRSVAGAAGGYPQAAALLGRRRHFRFACWRHIPIC